jgi:predicted transcriptional regulator
MEIHLSESLQSRLSELASHRGQNSEALAVEAIERLVAYDDWFLQEVQKGEDASERGELIDHAEVRAAAENRYRP